MSRTKLLDRAARLPCDNPHQQVKKIINLGVMEMSDSITNDAKARRAFNRLVANIRTRSKLLSPALLCGSNRLARIKSIIQICAALAEVSSRWIRPPETWTVPADKVYLTAARQTHLLIGHLLVKNSVPAFSWRCWYGEPTEESHELRKLFLHLGAGNSIRGTTCGKSLTREMAANLDQAPHHATLEQAIRYARTGEPPCPEPFYPAGTTRRRRKTWRTRPARKDNISWDPIAVPNFYHTESVYYPMRHERTWIIRQLTNKGQLNHEASRMQHCVRWYLQDCLDGDSSIWTMESRDTIRTRGLLTIEVTPETRHVVQVRGFRNRDPHPHETEIIRRWAAQSSLTLASIRG